MSAIRHSSPFIHSSPHLSPSITFNPLSYVLITYLLRFADSLSILHFESVLSFESLRKPHIRKSYLQLGKFHRRREEERTLRRCNCFGPSGCSHQSRFVYGPDKIGTLCAVILKLCSGQINRDDPKAIS